MLLFIKKITCKMEAEAIFLNPFTVSSSCEQQFVVCPFVDEETSGSYPFVNGLDGLAHQKERAIAQYGSRLWTT
jgi:hypothetical protein